VPTRTGRGKDATARKFTTGDRRQPRSRDDEVVEAAIKVFSRSGYAAATVQDVANELGILKGSLYHYIETKEDLLVWIFEQVHADVDEIIQEVSATEDLDPTERIALYVRKQVLYNLTHLDRISIYHHDLDALTGERHKQVVALRRQHHRFLTDLIRDAQSKGLADSSGDPHLLANCVFATIIWTYRWYRPGGGFGREAVADTCAAFALNGIASTR
jgi:AcrR family transcriptional regulator